MDEVNLLLVIPTRDIFAAHPEHVQYLSDRELPPDRIMDLALDAWQVHLVTENYEELHHFCCSYLFMYGYEEVFSRAECENMVVCLAELLEVMCRRIDAYLRPLVFNSNDYGVENVTIDQMVGFDSAVRIMAFELASNSNR